MNNERRGRLGDLLEKLEPIKNQVEGILSKVEVILDEEKDARDHYPENLMGSSPCHSYRSAKALRRSA